MRYGWFVGVKSDNALSGRLGGMCMRAALLNRKFELLLFRWRLINYRSSADPEVIPAAVWWIDGEVAEINKTLEG